VRVALVDHSLRHEALYYEGQDGFLLGALPFVSAAVDGGEAVILALAEQRAAPLRDALGWQADRVHFAEPAQLAAGATRASAVAWRGLLAEHAGDRQGLLVLSEPALLERRTGDGDAADDHHALLELMLAREAASRLLCAYDLAALGADAIDAARSAHPALMHEGLSRRDGALLEFELAAGALDGSLPAPPLGCEELSFAREEIGALRALVAARCAELQMDVDASADLVLAINELATNSVQHGGGRGKLRIWREREDVLVCEVSDRGFIRDPLAGRVRPPVDQQGGRGLWLVTHLCDLAQIRSAPSGTDVRVRMRRSGTHPRD
jgi:anti-sigma regulatory factor (Ser/Thr protein kinase)